MIKDQRLSHRCVTAGVAVHQQSRIFLRHSGIFLQVKSSECCWILIKSNFDRGSACKVVQFLYSAAPDGVYLVHLSKVKMSCIYFFHLLSSSVQMWQIRLSCLLASQCMVLFAKLY